MIFRRQFLPIIVKRPSSNLHYLAGVLLLASVDASARDYYFSPSSLEGDAQSQADVDLSLFSKSNAQLPGVYSTSIVLNKQKLEEVSLTYTNDEDGVLHPALSPDQLRKWGIRIDAYPDLVQQPTDKPLTQPLGHFIPDASVNFDFNTMTLRISMPQAAISNEGRDYIDPSRWEDGVPTAFADYSISGAQHTDSDNKTDTNQYLNLRSGANLGGWRMRNYSTWSKSDDTNSWQSINTWVAHDIDILKAQFTAGQSSTRGDVFDSIQYNGVNIATDEDMLPYSQRGFAPTIRGTATSNAEISIRQNGYLIYQASVAPGAFEIKDLYSTTNSGDLEVTVKEADGTEHKFTQPYSSLALMQRPGQMKYEATVARYREDGGTNANEPLFAQGSVVYGLNNFSTLYGGLTGSEDYYAANVGTGIALGAFGSVSLDITLAQARLDNDETSTGQSLRLLYTGKIESTDTNFTLAGYRYSTHGYYSFADANQKYDADEDDWQFRYNKHNRLQLSVSQNVLGTSLYLSGYQQDYWNTSKKERSLSAGLNRTLYGMSFHLAYTYNKTDDNNSDQMVSFGVSVPLSKWLPNSWANYNLSNNKGGDTRQNLGFNGTLLDDQRLSYSLQQSRSNHDGESSSSVYGSYRSQYANFNSGYYYSSDNSQQLSYGVSGAIVAHPHGVTLSQPLGDTFAIINARGASGIRFQNQRGVATDVFGNAIIPSLTPYQINNIRVDTTSLPEDVDTNATTLTTIPSRSAAVAATLEAQVGYRALIKLSRSQNRSVPFGAIASANVKGVTGIVDDTSTLYLAGIGESTRLLIKWGTGLDQQCAAQITIDATQPLTNPTGIRTIDALCQQVTAHAE
ncbi:fimbria/pilus outer membrane usher protein [Scandinavium sp. V105_16]|uniref:Fimbria/pilus outer membrane usher protein n=1 Tax=Scandinavium lactucae TaxID=3095028 RepID=A0AAJ2S705_9ENTR|nr:MULTISPECIES: fimbria/pilus outer membrane usher protein [unclassified Scandinavium]MDX6019941.1 fimbria/pilus outer membrane usher protein [Scandinavium sp. V105_16]MDX6031244.1 fimbria/pilus outer membrane usher protein [Scandinavium sp. V105_12]